MAVACVALRWREEAAGDELCVETLAQVRRAAAKLGVAWPGGVQVLHVGQCAAAEACDELGEPAGGPTGLREARLSELAERDLAPFAAVVLVNFAQHEQVRLEAFVHWNGAQLFTSCNVFGLALSLFFSRGAAPEVPHEEEPRRVIVAPNSACSVKRVAPDGLVHLCDDQPVPFQEGDLVVLSALRGRSAAAAEELLLQVDRVLPERFQVRVSPADGGAGPGLVALEGLQPGHGVVEKVQEVVGGPREAGHEEKEEAFSSLADSLARPHVDLSRASAYPEMAEESLRDLHFALQGLAVFEQRFQFLPSPGNNEHASMVTSAAQRAAADAAALGRAKPGTALQPPPHGWDARSVCEPLCRFAGTPHPLLCTAVAKVVVRVLTGRPLPVRAGCQRVLFHAFEVLDAVPTPGEAAPQAASFETLIDTPEVEDLVAAKLAHLERFLQP